MSSSPGALLDLLRDCILGKLLMRWRRLLSNSRWVFVACTCTLLRADIVLVFGQLVALSLSWIQRLVRLDLVAADLSAFWDNCDLIVVIVTRFNLLSLVTRVLTAASFDHDSSLIFEEQLL